MKDQLLNSTIEKIRQLDESRLQSVNNFIELLSTKSYNKVFTDCLAKLGVQSKPFEFLNDEPDLYTDADLIYSK